MYSSLILTDLATDRRNDLIAAADAHRVAGAARLPRLRRGISLPARQPRRHPVPVEAERTCCVSG